MLQATGADNNSNLLSITQRGSYNLLCLVSELEQASHRPELERMRADILPAEEGVIGATELTVAL